MDAEISSRIELKVLAEDDVANDVHGSTKQLLGTNELSKIKNFWNTFETFRINSRKSTLLISKL